MIQDLQSVWTALLEVEQSEDLYRWRVGRVYLWPLLRDRLLREIAEQSGLIEKRIEPAKASKQDLSWQASWPSVPSLAAKTLVIPFLRRDAAGRDQFSARFVDAFEDSVAVMSVGYADLGKPTPQLEDIEAFVRGRYRNRAKVEVALSLRPWHNAKYERVMKSIEARIGQFGARYAKFPKWLLVDFVAQELGYRDLFRASGTEKLIYVNAWRRGLIAGAKAAGVSVIEPQHGAISKLHPLLSWPKSASPAYLPDVFLAWGQHWVDACGLPDNVATAIIGAPDAFAEVRGQLEAGRLPKHGDRVVIASQVHQTQAILEFATRAASENPDLEIVVKPHPQEDPELIAASLAKAPKNLTALDSSEPLLPLMAGAAAVVGVYSTALFEAAALGVPVGVLKLTGWQHAAVLIERGDALALTDRLPKELLDLKQNPDSASYYFASALPANTAGLSALRQLIKEVTDTDNDR